MGHQYCGEGEGVRGGVEKTVKANAEGSRKNGKKEGRAIRRTRRGERLPGKLTPKRAEVTDQKRYRGVRRHRRSLAGRGTPTKKEQPPGNYPKKKLTEGVKALGKNNGRGTLAGGGGGGGVDGRRATRQKR